METTSLGFRDVGFIFHGLGFRAYTLGGSDMGIERVDVGSLRILQTQTQQQVEQKLETGLR